jgi:hypothetical protein
MHDPHEDDERKQARHSGTPSEKLPPGRIAALGGAREKRIR